MAWERRATQRCPYRRTWLRCRICGSAWTGATSSSRGTRPKTRSPAKSRWEPLPSGQPVEHALLMTGTGWIGRFAFPRRDVHMSAEREREGVGGEAKILRKKLSKISTGQRQTSWLWINCGRGLETRISVIQIPLVLRAGLESRTLTTRPHYESTSHACSFGHEIPYISYLTDHLTTYYYIIWRLEIWSRWHFSTTKCPGAGSAPWRATRTGWTRRHSACAWSAAMSTRSASSPSSPTAWARLSRSTSPCRKSRPRCDTGVTSILSQRLLHKMINPRVVVIARIHACWTSKLSQETRYLDSIISATFAECICRNISCALGKWSLHSRWNSIATFTELHVHGDERWPTEVTSYIFPLANGGDVKYVSPLTNGSDVKPVFPPCPQVRDIYSRLDFYRINVKLSWSPPPASDLPASCPLQVGSTPVWWVSFEFSGFHS